MSSDFAEIWYTKCAEYEYGVKILVRTFFSLKNVMFFGGGPPKSDRKLKLSDFDEIWYPGVFEGADFKNRIHFYAIVDIIFSTWGSDSWFLGSPDHFPKSCQKLES